MFRLSTTPQLHCVLLDQALSRLAPLYIKTTDDVAIPPFCLLSLMARGFASHRTWAGIISPSFYASNSSCIFCRPSVPFPRYCTRATASIFSLSQDSFPLTSTTPLLTVLAALMMMTWYQRAISAVAFWWVIAVIVPLAFLVAFMILMWAGACSWKSTLLIADAISWSILLGAGMLSSLLKIRHLSAMLDLVVRVWPGPVGTVWVCIHGRTISHLLVRIGVRLRLGLGSCCSSVCSVSCIFCLGYRCCCGWRFSSSPSCIAPACCEASRPPPSCLAVSLLPSVLASWAGAASYTLAVASTSTVLSAIPIPHCTLSLCHSSHFVSLSCDHSFRPSYCASAHAVWASSILAILSIVWCSWVTWCACCLTVRSIWLLQSPRALTDSEAGSLSLFPFLSHSHSSLAAMNNTCVIFPDVWLATPLASPASAMSICLSTGGFSIIPLIRLMPSLFAIVPGRVDVATSRCVTCVWPPLIVQGGLEVSF